MRGIVRKIFIFFVTLMPILIGVGQAFAEPVPEFTLNKGQSMFISAEHLQKRDILISENAAVAMVLDGIITANSVGETFCREVWPGENGEKKEKRFKIKVLPTKLIRYVFVEPNNPRPDEDLKLVAISDMSYTELNSWWIQIWGVSKLFPRNNTKMGIVLFTKRA